MRTLRLVANLAALLMLGGLGVTLIVAGVGGLSLASLWVYLAKAPGTIFVILVGVAQILAAIHFLLIVIDERRNSVVFSREGELGRIELTPHAVKEFIGGVLREEIGLEQFRIRLRHHGDGVAITVRTTTCPTQRVTEIGERIQRELSAHVAERTGVEVSDVVVLVRNIRASETGLKESTRDETYS